MQSGNQVVITVIGPSKVNKTAIAVSIARALNRLNIRTGGDLPIGAEQRRGEILGGVRGPVLIRQGTADMGLPHRNNRVSISIIGPRGSGKSVITGAVESALIGLGLPAQSDDGCNTVIDPFGKDGAVAAAILAATKPSVRIAERTTHPGQPFAAASNA